jgi:DNA repair protein RadC
MSALLYSVPRYHVELIRDSNIAYQLSSDSLLDSDNVVALLSPLLANLDREHFVVLGLDQKNRPIGLQTVAIGTLNQAAVCPRECYKSLILMSAASCILAHNHPSGNPAPSSQDDDYTQRMASAGKLLGIPVLDHLVIGDNAHYSYADSGTL